METVVALVVVVGSLSALGGEPDAGEGWAPDAGAPVTQGFDVVATPWGPGRKSAGEVFRSAAASLPDGPFRLKWNGFSLGVGGQYFARADARDNGDFKAGVRDEVFGFDQRARVTLRASAKERVGLLLDIQDVRAWGSEPSTTTLAPDAAFHQAFVDLKATAWLDVRVGRQELSYGEERLIGSLDWAQAARAFDGLFARFTASPHVTVDAFAMVLKPPAWLLADNGSGRFQNSGSYFTGAYSRVRFGKAGFDVYALGLLEDPGTVALGHQRDSNRLTVGTRAFGAVGGWAVVGEGALQTGTVGQANDALFAGAFALKATYTWSTVWGSPYVLGEFSAASGDGAPQDGAEHTFHQLFPTGHAHLGYMDYVGWQNVVAARGTVGFRPFGAHVWVDVHHFRAWDPKGAWYAANGAVFVAADPTRVDGNMGTEVDLSATVPVTEHFAVAGNFSVFMPGLEARARGTSAATWGFMSIRSQF